MRVVEDSRWSIGVIGITNRLRPRRVIAPEGGNGIVGVDLVLVCTREWVWIGRVGGELTTFNELLCAGAEVKTKLNHGKAETDARTVLGSVGSMEDVCEEEADELERERHDHVPEETKEVSRGHTVDQDLVAAERRGERPEWRVVGRQHNSSVPISRHSITNRIMV